jgi:hypothetical protein
MFSGSKKGSFLERFKGRTIQMSKDGHVGVVNSTKVPIKPSHDHASRSFSKNDYMPYSDDTNNKAQNSSYQKTSPKSNFEALSPLKRSFAMKTKFANQDGGQNHSFASNFKKSQQALEGNYNDMPAVMKRMQNAGESVMRYSASDTFSDVSQRMSKSISPTKPMYQSASQFRGGLQNPTRASYGQMGSSLQGFNDLEFKGSFYSSRTTNNVMNSSSYSMGVPQPYSSGNMNRMRNSGYNFSSASNSNGFYPTAVSTPAYDKNNENVKISSKAEEMIRRTEQLAKIHKPASVKDSDFSEIKQKHEMSAPRESNYRKIRNHRNVLSKELNMSESIIKKDNIKLKDNFRPRKLNFTKRNSSEKR